MRGILHIISLEHEKNKPFQNTVGTGLVPVLNDNETMGNVCNDLEEDGDGNDNNSCDRASVCTESDRMGTRPIPTAFYDMIGTFKSLSHNEYSFHVRNNGWPPFRKRLWQLRFHDHIIGNDDELNRIRTYIRNNPKNWEDDENNPKNIR